MPLDRSDEIRKVIRDWLQSNTAIYAALAMIHGLHETMDAPRTDGIPDDPDVLHTELRLHGMLDALVTMCLEEVRIATGVRPDDEDEVEREVMVLAEAFYKHAKGIAYRNHN